MKEKKVKIASAIGVKEAREVRPKKAVAEDTLATKLLKFVQDYHKKNPGIVIERP